MHDDTALTVDRTRRVLNERVRPAIHAEAVPLTLAASPLPGEPVPPAEGMAGDYAPFAVGTPWGPAWGTTWFRLRGTVPQAWAGRRVEALIDPGFDPVEPGFQAEGLVYRPGGEPVKSINPRNHWVPIADAAAGGEDVELFVEAASNPVVFGEPRFSPTYQGDILTASREPLYTFRRADLAVMEPDVFELALDLEVLLELQAELPATSPRRMRILQALDDALDRLVLQRIAATASEAREPLAGVLASTAEPSAHRLSAVGHAHIDSAWLWPVRETIRKVARTTASMTELIASTDDFVYGMSSAQQYKWIKEHRPEVYAKVRDAVAAGRFLPLGGMWVESDTTMPSGEAMARQFLYGQRFFEAEFGVRSRGVWLPDSFGYSAALPQLMRRAGFEWFFTRRSPGTRSTGSRTTRSRGRASTGRGCSATSRRWTPTTPGSRARRSPARRGSSASRGGPRGRSPRSAGATAAAGRPARWSASRAGWPTWRAAPAWPGRAPTTSTSAPRPSCRTRRCGSASCTWRCTAPP